MPILVLQRLALEAILDFFYWPVWWYTRGAKHAVVWCWSLFVGAQASLAPGLWLKNIFVPMYAQYDWQGRIVSFMMRVIQIIFRSVASFLFLLFCGALFLIWLVIPIFVIYNIVLSVK